MDDSSNRPAEGLPSSYYPAQQQQQQQPQQQSYSSYNPDQQLQHDHRPVMAQPHSQHAQSMSSQGEGSVASPRMAKYEQPYQQQMQQQQQQHQQQYMMPQHHLPPHQQHAPPHYATIPPQYHYPNGAVPLSMSATVGANGMRFPLPHAPMTAHLGGGRHKKDIKRRTKTGCLTCRKRRIKCDEEHPACRNCLKSKRECLGYDPVFKQQGPVNIQPTPPASIATPPPLAAAHVALPSNHYQQHPHPHPHPHPYPPSATTYSQSASATGSEPPPVDYPSIDPELAGGDPSYTMAQPNYGSDLQPERTVKPMAINDLFALNDIPAQYQMRDVTQPPSPQSQHEIAEFYRYHFAPGLDLLLETNWYSIQSLPHLQQDLALQDFVGQCVDIFKTRSDDPNVTRTIPSLEARLVWKLATLPRMAANRDHQILEILPRLDTLESLLTGQFLNPAYLSPAPQPGVPANIYNSQFFWHHLGRCVLARDDQPEGVKEVKAALDNMRNILGNLENRDVLYSIAVARHIGGRMPSFHPSRPFPATNNDPNDVNKLKVAHNFVENEERGGTTQVIQRVCGMALRSWALAKQ